MNKEIYSIYFELLAVPLFYSLANVIKVFTKAYNLIVYKDDIENIFTSKSHYLLLKIKYNVINIFIFRVPQICQI